MSQLANALHVRDADVPHNIAKLAAAVVGGVQANNDPRTLQAWGRAIGVSRGALRTLCYATHTSPRNALDMMRTLRVVCRHSKSGHCCLDWLDVADQRTVNRLLKRGGMTPRSFMALTDVVSLLRSQQYVRDERIVTAIIERLEAQPVGMAPLTTRLA